MKSYYIREGELKKSEEKLLLIKSTEDKQEALIEFIEKLHPYDIPEIVVIEPKYVNETYAQRLASE